MISDDRNCILFVTLEFYPTTGGGAGALIHNTAQLLLQRGYEVVLLVDFNREQFERLVERDRLSFPNGHRLHAYRLDALCNDLSVHLQEMSDPEAWRSIKTDHALRHILDLHRVDLIEFYDYCGPAFHFLTSPRGARPPVAIRLHNTIELIERKTRAPLSVSRIRQYAMERAQLALADALLTPGQRYYDKEIRAIYPLEADRERVLVSPPVHLPIGTVAAGAEANDIAFYGRLSTFKGLDTFVRAAVLALRDGEFSDWVGRFLIIGPEETVATALSLAEIRDIIPGALSDRFQFVGFVKRAELAERLGSVAFACFANRIESFGYAAHELNTAGVPLVLNRTPAFEDHFENDVDAVFFDGTARDLAARMIAMSRDPELRARLGARGMERGSRPLVDHYEAHLAALRARRANRPQPPTLSGLALILSDGNVEAERRTLRSTRSWYSAVLRRGDDGPIRFAGDRWHVAPGDTGAAEFGFEPVPDAVLFVRAGDLVEADFLSGSLRVLAENERVGAVAGWLHTSLGIVSVQHVYIPELGRAAAPGLRTVIRTRAGQTVAEYLQGWSLESEVSYLLEHRVAGRVIVEMPAQAVDTRWAIDLPRVQGAAETQVDFDRSSREFLTLAQLLLPDGADRPNSDDPDLLMTLVEPSLVSLRGVGEGEVWVLRLFRVGDGREHGVHEPWESVMRIGEWNHILEPTSPAGGALRTRSGTIRFYARGRTAIELLHAPFCGNCEIVYRGRVHSIDLQTETLGSRVIWLDEIGQSGGIEKSAADAPVSIRQFAPLIRPEHAAVSPADGGFIMVLSATSALSTALRLAFGSRAFASSELGIGEADPTEGIRYTLSLLRHLEARRVAIDSSVPGGTEIVRRFLERHPDNTAVVLLERVSATSAGSLEKAYRALGPWLRLAEHFRGRLSAAGTQSGLIELFPHSGVEAILYPEPLPRFANVDEQDAEAPIDLIVLPASTIVPSCTHMILGSCFARRNGLEIQTIWLPERHAAELDVATTFDVARSARIYKTLDLALLDDPSRRRLALSVYPDDVPLDDAAAQAIGRGVLPILGPSSALADSDAPIAGLAVTYWEDAAAIAETITWAASHFSELVGGYERFRETRLETARTALAAIAGQSR